MTSQQPKSRMRDVIETEFNQQDAKLYPNKTKEKQGQAGGKTVRDTGNTGARQEQESGETGARQGRDTGETWARHRRDTGETRARHGRDTGETLARHWPDIGGTQGDNFQTNAIKYKNLRCINGITSQKWFLTNFPKNGSSTLLISQFPFKK